jgi:hypothetical protein
MVDVRAANRSFTTIDPSYAGGGPVTFSSGGAARWVLIKTKASFVQLREFPTRVKIMLHVAP